MQSANRRFWLGCEWGLVATLVMTSVMLLVYFVGPRSIPPMPLAVTSGILARVFGVATVGVWVVVLAVIVQLIYGALWGGLLAASTRDVTIGKALAVSLGLWVLMVIFYVPMA